MPADATRIGRAVGEHWAIENRLHWCLDVTSNGDASRIRKDHGPQNMAVLRRLSVNLLRQIELGPRKVSLRGRLIMANHDPAFILRALGVDAFALQDPAKAGPYRAASRTSRTNSSPSRRWGSSL